MVYSRVSSGQPSGFVCASVGGTPFAAVPSTLVRKMSLRVAVGLFSQPSRTAIARTTVAPVRVREFSAARSLTSVGAVPLAV